MSSAKNLEALREYYGSHEALVDAIRTYRMQRAAEREGAWPPMLMAVGEMAWELERVKGESSVTGRAQSATPAMQALPPRSAEARAIIAAFAQGRIEEAERRRASNVPNA